MAIDFEKLRPRFEAAAAAQPLFKGWDWCDLSDEEAEVFEIDPERWPLMLTAYDCFSGLMGASDNDWYDMKDEDIGDTIDGFDPAKFNVEDFMVFGKEMGLTHREAFTVWRKVEWWQMRNGVMVFKDERVEPGRKDRPDNAPGFDDMDDGIPI
jgi:hypothetical protein